MASEEIKKALMESGLRLSAADEPVVPDPECTRCDKGCVFTGCNVIACAVAACVSNDCALGCNNGCLTWLQIIFHPDNA